MTFLEIRQRIAEQLGLSSSDTTPDDNATLTEKFKEWVNARYRLLCAKRSWTWLIKDTILQTTTDVTTGTANVTNNSATVILSSNLSVSAAGWFVKFEGSDDWYEVSTGNAGAPLLGLADVYLGTTNTAATYTLRKKYYVLPSDTSKVLSMKQTRDDVPLKYVSPRHLDRRIPDRTRTGEPEFYSIVGLQSSSRSYRVEFYPVPNVAMNINVRYYHIPSELSSDSDVPVIPPAYHEYLVWDVLGTYGYSFLDDTRLTYAKAEAKSILSDMIKNEVAAEDIPVRAPFDDQMSSNESLLGRLDTPIE